MNTSSAIILIMGLCAVGHCFIPIAPDQLMSWLAPEKCPESCPQISIPVCGSDDVTYLNECVLKQEICKQGTGTQLSQKAFGSCNI